jgi:hypothetical protein
VHLVGFTIEIEKLYYDARFYKRQILVNVMQFAVQATCVQGGREVTVHPDNTRLRLNISLHCTSQHAVQCKMVGWQHCAR